jgi:hypothetical protein
MKSLTKSKGNRSISFPAGALGALAIGKLTIGRAQMKSLRQKPRASDAGWPSRRGPAAESV